MPLRFLPLGGSGEIGMNLNLYEYGGKWLMVDCGVTFAHDLGLELITPDPSYIIDRRDDLVGLVLTHAHEDHIGAIVLLWPQLKCPLYATPFTAALIRRKLQRAGLLDQVELNVIPIKGTFNLEPFSLEYVTLTHSIPEPNALVIKTPAGSVVHTGDWKLDPNPLIGEVSDQKRLEELGDEGVLALVCDSTNATLAGRTGSEADVREALTDLVAQQKDRVAIACFASNVTRLETAARVAEATGRQVALVGLSLWRMYEASKEVGYLTNVSPFLKAEEAMGLPKNEVLLVCTGSQGEERAALARISQKQHPEVHLSAGDTVIFSSRMIPGNEEQVHALHLRLEEQDINVITSEETFTHVSGHPAQDDLKDMYAWVRPQVLVPVHGERRHMKVQAKLGEEAGIPHTIIPHNGSLIELVKDKAPKVMDTVPAGRWALDGQDLIPLGSPHLKERERLKEAGFVAVTIVVDAKARLIASPQMTFMGVSSKDRLLKTQENVENAIEDALLEMPHKDRDQNELALENHGVRVAFITLENTQIEFLEPLGESSPVAGFLKKNPRGGMHHLCFDVEGVEKAKKHAEGKGARFLDPKKVGAHGVHIASIVLILPSDIDRFVGKLVTTFTTFTVFWALYRALDPFSFVLDKLNLTGELKGFFITLTRILILVIGVLSVLQGWGVNVGAFLAGLGLMTMAIGLAAQDTLKNFFGSLSIFMERTSKKGDWIKTPDVEGTIEAVSIRTTAVRRFDKTLVTIPNAKLADAAVVNFTRMTNRRIFWRIGLTYSTTSQQLENVVKKIRQYLEDNPKIETNPKKTTTLGTHRLF
uniref:Ribonuclease J 1 n=1 Tax=Stylophora pistillata TaxID=50429 RepID=A0A2B4R176_STYPI